VPEGLLNETKKQRPVPMEHALLGQTFQSKLARGHDESRLAPADAGP
jgi:hypothetical protein